MPLAIYETEEEAEDAGHIAKNIAGQHVSLHEAIDFHCEVIHQE